MKSIFFHIKEKLVVCMESTDLVLENFEEYFNNISEIIFDYRNNLSEGSVISPKKYPDLYKEFDEDVPNNGMGKEELLQVINEKIIPSTSKVGHPLFLAWMNNAGSDAGFLGELLNIGLNQIPFMYKAGPAVTVIEDIIIKWFSKLTGFGDSGGGTLVSGGTMANLTALLTAREIKGNDVMRKGLECSGKMILYMSEQGHTSIERAAGILGLGADNIRRVPVDQYFRMNPDELQVLIENDIKSGFKPFCVIAQGGSAGAGAVDPIEKINGICRKYDLWLHVDAAYGGAALLSDEKRKLFNGIESADSITIDPHKWFYVPAEAGLVLLKQKEHLYNTFTKTSCKAYKSNEDEKNYLDYGIQTARVSRALKIWFSFKTYGLDRIKSCVEQNITCADELRRLFNNTPGWEILNPVDLSIVCLRYTPDSLTDINKINDFQNIILKELEKSGKAFLTSVTLNRKTGIRVCFANHRTTLQDVKFLHETLTDIAKGIVN